jgi:hypothetical protein
MRYVLHEFCQPLDLLSLPSPDEDGPLTWTAMTVSKVLGIPSDEYRRRLVPCSRNPGRLTSSYGQTRETARTHITIWVCTSFTRCNNLWFGHVTRAARNH